MRQPKKTAGKCWQHQTLSQPEDPPYSKSITQKAITGDPVQKKNDPHHLLCEVELFHPYLQLVGRGPLWSTPFIFVSAL